MLKKKYSQVYQNFENDHYVNSITLGKKTLKDVFFEQVDGLDDDSQFKSKADAFCYSYKRKGPPYSPIFGDEAGGTAVPLAIFIKDLVIEIQDYLLSNPGSGLGTISPSELRKHLLDAALKKDFKGIHFVRKSYGLDNVFLRRSFSVMWSYINEKNRQDIFYDMDQEEISTLPCTLGLDPDTFGEVYICFAHQLESNVLSPTAMDAGMCSYWRPGGMTRPHDSCPDYKGKIEVVHKPNTMKNLLDKIEIIEVVNYETK